MPMRCPWCRESISRRERAASCPHCGRTTETAQGEPLRPLDLDYAAILADADERSLAWTRRGAIAAVALAAFSLVPAIGGALSFVLLVVAQFFWAGVLVSRPYHRHFSALRRIVTRWVRRLAMVLVVLPAHSAAFIPFVALVISPAVFAGTCWLTRAYARFHLAREKDRIPVTIAEKMLVVALAIVAVGGLCVAGLLVYLGLVTLDALGL